MNSLGACSDPLRSNVGISNRANYWHGLIERKKIDGKIFMYMQIHVMSFTAILSMCTIKFQLYR